MTDVFADAARALSGDAAAARDATYTPQGGAAIALTVEDGTGVILSHPDETEALFATGTRRPSTVADVPVAALPARPANGDTLDVGEESFTVRSGELGPSGVIWRLDLDSAGG